MAKKQSNKSGAKKGAMSAQDHRQKAEAFHAKARLHSAQADLMDAKNPPKNRGPHAGRIY